MGYTPGVPEVLPEGPVVAGTPATARRGESIQTVCSFNEEEKRQKSNQGTDSQKENPFQQRTNSQH
jgi:hypothetical protein